MNPLEQCLKSVYEIGQHLELMYKNLDSHNATLIIIMDCIKTDGQQIQMLKDELEALRKEIEYLKTEVLRQ